MKIAEFFLSESFQFLVVKFSIYLNKRVFVMYCISVCNCCTSWRVFEWGTARVRTGPTHLSVLHTRSTL